MICTVRNSVSVRSLNLRTPGSPAWKVRCAPRRTPSPAHAKMCVCVCGCARCHVGSDVILRDRAAPGGLSHAPLARSRVLYTSELEGAELVRLGTAGRIAYSGRLCQVASVDRMRCVATR